MGKKYVKCPRCELNYILEGEDYCHVCKSEMKHHSEQDEDEILDFDDLEICPVCGTNFVKENETMCSECKAKMKGEKSQADWEDDENEMVSTDADNDETDEYNSGFSDIDPTNDDIDPYKIEDDVDIDDSSDESLDFAVEEEIEETFEEESVDDFETVEITDDDDDEEDEEDDDEYDFDDDDMLGSHK